MVKHPHNVHTRGGFTLPEALIALSIAGILASIAVASGARLADTLAVRSAARELRTSLAAARHLAVLRATHAVVYADTLRRVVVVSVAAETASVDVLARGVLLSATRDSVTYAANGLGWGAANTRLVVRRGAAAETVTVSRLGRVR